jgi:hypothetical protein
MQYTSSLLSCSCLVSSAVGQHGQRLPRAGHGTIEGHMDVDVAQKSCNSARIRMNAAAKTYELLPKRISKLMRDSTELEFGALHVQVSKAAHYLLAHAHPRTNETAALLVVRRC